MIALADEREDARRGGDGGERDERRADDVTRRALVRERGARQRHARDDPERRRGHRDQRGGDEVGVGEARDRAGPEPARRSGGRRRRRPGARSAARRRAPARRSGSRRRARRAVPSRRAAPAPLSGTEQRHDPVHERPPGARDDAVLVHPPEDHRQADDAAERVAGGSGAVAVEGGEPARGERGVEVRDRRRNEEDEGIRGRLLRNRRQPAGELLCRPVVRQDAERDRGHRHERERQPVRGQDAPERAGGTGARETRQHGDAHGAGGQDEDEEDARRRRRSRRSRRRGRTPARSRRRPRPRGR